ncbi:hypothetical protein ACP4OV_008875 [Aristida adscensionis]
MLADTSSNPTEPVETNTEDEAEMYYSDSESESECIVPNQAEASECIGVAGGGNVQATKAKSMFTPTKLVPCMGNKLRPVRA